MTLGGIEDFAIERYFACWEFSVRHQLSASDVEPYSLKELLELADDDARQRWEQLSLGYTESSGLPALREEIARLYPGFGVEQILVAAGAEEMILLVMLATLQSGDEAIVVTPAYQSLRSVPEALGAKVVEVRLREENGWRLDPEDIARARTPRTRVIVVNFPHNPTGSHLDEAALRRIAAIAEEAGALLFSDEVYRGLEYRESDRLPPAATLSSSAVSLGVMSKSFALAGLRIGWLASRNSALLDRVARLKDYTTICSSAPSEVLALIALRNRDAVLARSRAIVADNLGHARAFMAEHQARIEWIPPRAGSVAMPRFRDLDAAEVSQQLASSRAALLMPGAVFGMGRNHFRLGLGRRDLPHALSALAQAISRV